MQDNIKNVKMEVDPNYFWRLWIRVSWWANGDSFYPTHRKSQRLDGGVDVKYLAVPCCHFCTRNMTGINRIYFTLLILEPHRLSNVENKLSKIPKISPKLLVRLVPGPLMSNPLGCWTALQVHPTVTHPTAKFSLPNFRNFLISFSPTCPLFWVKIEFRPLYL